MAGNRPYFVTYKGAEHMVEAASPHAAVSHVVGEDIKCQPATGADVLQWARNGKPIEKAGDKPQTIAIATGQEFTVDDARAWLEVNSVDTNLALTTWDAMVERGHLAHGDMVDMIKASPAFVELLAWMPGGVEQMTNEAMLAKLDGADCPIDEVVDRMSHADKLAAGAA